MTSTNSYSAVLCSLYERLGTPCPTILLDNPNCPAIAIAHPHNNAARANSYTNPVVLCPTQPHYPNPHDNASLYEPNTAFPLPTSTLSASATKTTSFDLPTAPGYSVGPDGGSSHSLTFDITVPGTTFGITPVSGIPTASFGRTITSSSMSTATMTAAGARRAAPPAGGPHAPGSFKSIQRFSGLQISLTLFLGVGVLAAIIYFLDELLDALV
ncbi:unnamed protein product [Tilletia controversa]|nr:unnamed protein product [Tilletia controversa]